MKTWLNAKNTLNHFFSLISRCFPENGFFGLSIFSGNRVFRGIDCFEHQVFRGIDFVWEIEFFRESSLFRKSIFSGDRSFLGNALFGEMSLFGKSSSSGNNFSSKVEFFGDSSFLRNRVFRGFDFFWESSFSRNRVFLTFAFGKIPNSLKISRNQYEMIIWYKIIFSFDKKILFLYHCKITLQNHESLIEF